MAAEPKRTHQDSAAVGRAVGAGRLKQYLSLGGAIRITDIDFHQEAVELGFRQRIGAFLLKRVLRCQDVKWLGQVVTGSGDGHMLLLHRLQKC